MHRPTGPAPENPAVGRSGVTARGRLILVTPRVTGEGKGLTLIFCEALREICL